MDQTPVEQILAAMDALDAEATLALITPDCVFLTVDGRQAVGKEAVRTLLTDFLGMLRATSHRVTGQWHDGDVWFAEVDSTYELQDRLRLEGLPRAFLVKADEAGVSVLRVYGARERPLDERPNREAGVRVGARWIPPL
jgi:hypothetical protein